MTEYKNIALSNQRYKKNKNLSKVEIYFYSKVSDKLLLALSPVSAASVNIATTYI